jgi:hypothetical protein
LVIGANNTLWRRNGLGDVGRACHAVGVVPSVEVIARVPAENLHVSRAEFGAVWTAAQTLSAERLSDWYLIGVCVTCQWVAQVIVPPSTMPGHPARAPVTGTSRMAYAELIERESLAAQRQAMRPPVWMLTARPGWVEAVDATFAWLWRRTGPPPVVVKRAVSEPATP